MLDFDSVFQSLGNLPNVCMYPHQDNRRIFMPGYSSVMLTSRWTPTDLLSDKHLGESIQDQMFTLESIITVSMEEWNKGVNFTPDTCGICILRMSKPHVIIQARDANDYLCGSSSVYLLQGVETDHGSKSTTTVYEVVPNKTRVVSDVIPRTEYSGSASGKHWPSGYYCPYNTLLQRMSDLGASLIELEDAVEEVRNHPQERISQWPEVAKFASRAANSWDHYIHY